MKNYTIVILLSVFCCSCASIINGSRQYVPITSTPTGAKVIMNEKEFGTTPMRINMKRGTKEHYVKLELDGYEPYQAFLVRKVDAWIIENILFGGLIGLGIDALSGGMYHLTPDNVNAQLKPIEDKTSK